MANQNTPGNIADNFWEHVDTSGNCWIFLRRKNHLGYGKMAYQGRQMCAHRFAWFLHYLSWPKQTLDHLCRNPSCVNPLHLEDVSMRENTMRGLSPSAKNARKTHCKRGHPLSGSNLAIQKGKYGPQRRCKACVKIRDLARKQPPPEQGQD